MNILSLDGCSSTCKLETGWTCTAATGTVGAGVAGVCTTTCGDGIVVDGPMAINKNTEAEDCDDDTLTGCAATCKVGPNPGWQCTHSGSLAGSACQAICENVLGAFPVNAPFTCNDGDGDGATDGCHFCTVQPGWVCDNTL